MSRLKTVAGKNFENLLAAAPGALEADSEMRRQIQVGLSPRLYSLIAVAVSGLLRCERFAEGLRGPLDAALASQVARDWRKASLDPTEMAVLAYTEKGTLEEASVRRGDLEALRQAGFPDRDMLSVATAIAYHNYSIRVAAAFDVLPR